MKSLLKYIIVLLFLPMASWSQFCDLNNYTAAYIIASNEYPYFSPSSGITVSATWNCPTLNNFNYSCQGNVFTTKSPAWWINSATHFITLTFSAPVSNFSIVVNGTNTNEVFYHAAATGTIDLQNYCTPDYNTPTATSLIYTNAPASGTLISINNPAGSTQYTLTHNGTGSGSRYALLDCFVGVVPLAVEITSFEGEAEGKVNKLQWETASETQNDHFVLERSRDGEHYEEMITVAGAGNYSSTLTYNEIDRKPYDLTYYRLKQVDFNGDYTYHGPVLIENNSIIRDVQVFPNPTNGLLSIEGGLQLNTEVYNTMGELLQSHSLVATIDISNLPAGIYYLKLYDEYGVSTKRVVKQ